MSCHTWTYKKVSALSEEKKQDIAQKAIEEAANWWGFKATLAELTEEVAEWMKEHPEIFDEEEPSAYAENMVQQFKDQLADLQEHGFEAVVKYDRDTSNFAEHNGELYYLIGFDVPVRVRPQAGGEYPEETFTDRDEFLEFLRTTDCNIWYHDIVAEGYVDHVYYHNGYSDEVIRVVKEYFAKHGEDNLYITFG